MIFHEYFSSHVLLVFMIRIGDQTANESLFGLMGQTGLQKTNKMCRVHSHIWFLVLWFYTL